ncbi:MAG: carboxymuconolactone decarboxylase family protein [Pseudomonadales bacterium]
MRLSEPRIPALAESDWNEKVEALMKPFVARGSVLNIFRTMANHPDLARRWMVFGNHVLGKSTLAIRERELVILRIGYLCQSGYEWGQHVLISREAGMTEAEIRSAKTGPDTADLSELDRLLFAATDELYKDAHITDTTWSELSRFLSRQQMMDLVFTVGQYNLVSMALNSFGVQADEGLPGWDV